MTRRILVACVLTTLTLSVLGVQGRAQSRKVSPPSRYGPSGSVGGALISPDGRTIVYQLTTSSGDSLEVVTDAGVRTLLQGTFANFQFTPDSRSLVYQGAGRPILAVPVDGSSAPRRLTPPSLDVDWGRTVQLSALGWVVFLGHELGSEVTNDVYAVPLTGRQPPVKLDGANLPHGGAWYFEVSPDGAWVGFVSDPAASGDYELYVAPVTGAAPARKVSGPLLVRGLVQGFRFTPTSEHLVYRANALRLGSSSLFSVPVLGTGPAVRLDEGSTGSVQQDYQLSRDGQFAFYRHNASQNTRPELFRVPIKGQVAPTRLSAPLVAGGGVSSFTLAPDGSVLYRADQEVDNRQELYHVPLVGAPRKLNAPLDPAQDVAAYQVAPDGVRVLFVVEPPGSVYLGALRGVPGPVLLPDGPTGPVRPPFSISASGAYLVFPEVADTPSTYDLGGLYSLRLDGFSAPLELVPASPEFSVRYLQLELEGERVLVAANTGYAQELFAVPIAGGGLPARTSGPLPMNRPLDNVGTSELSADGRWAVFTFGEFGYGVEHNVYSADLELGTPAVRLTPAPISGQGAYLWFRIAPGAERVVFHSSSGGLHSVPIDGSARPLLLDVVPNTAELQFAPDGEHVLYLDAARRLHSARLDGSQPPALLGGFEGIGTVTFHRFRISPDGTRVAYHFRGSSVLGTYLLSAPLDGSGPPVLLDPAHGAERLLGVTEGGRVVFQTPAAAGVTLRSVPIDGGAAPIALATASLYQTSEDDAVAVAGDDVVYLAPISSLFVVPADGHAASRPLTPGFGVWTSFWFTPNRFFFIGHPTGSGPIDLYSLPRDLSGAPARVSRATAYGFLFRAVESADGERVAYLQEATFGPYGADRALYSAPSDGSGEPRRLSEPLVVLDYEEERIQPDFQLSRDGRTVAFRQEFNHYADGISTSEVYAAPSNASRPTQQISAAPRDQRRVQQFHLDPRGRFALYSGDQDVPGLNELFVAPIPASSGRTRPR